MNALPKKEDLVPYTGGMGWARYIPIPGEVLEWGLSGTALVIYCLLLERMNLSRKNGRRDEAGALYVNYTTESLAGSLGYSRSTVLRVLHELEQKGLVRRESQGKKAVRYYPQGLTGWEKAGGKQDRSAKPVEEAYKAPKDLGDLDWVLQEMAQNDASF